MTATVDDVFAALASPVRRDLLRLLLDGERTVNDLAAHFAMARPSVSEHLRVLRETGLVAETRHGRERRYRLEPGPLMGLADWLHPYERFWRRKLADLRTVLDEEDDS
ncbi:metalloregulator ArsR/SmtB family transcription factor [Actinomadura kijaniata]|uniref:DNA-binding transcriptional ArsR family regulator n=1 Tax=Actinomadura namibiensis TaxID=182080 RepID=A0A7W3QLW3_ACTNM|nr:metalloregulator ArsR/SmtB family transcription factor [Actinomadura namibiensis]MBA8951403.1 DNA-binding transcriptional ArsR family regulator [Actinomadura namibiensis]